MSMREWMVERSGRKRGEEARSIEMRQNDTDGFPQQTDSLQGVHEQCNGDVSGEMRRGAEEERV